MHILPSRWEELVGPECAFQRFRRGCFQARPTGTGVKIEEPSVPEKVSPRGSFGNHHALAYQQGDLAMKHTPQVKPRGHTAKGWHAAHHTPAPKGPFLVTNKGKRQRKAAKILPFPPPSA
jgi:hypothetical protein